MSQPLAPRPFEGGGSPNSSLSPHRSRKISTACLACKQRKTKCSGGSPCAACAQRTSPCVYDASSDQRRKIANQRNVQDLQQSLQDLQQSHEDLQQSQEDLDRARQLLGGIIAIVRVGDSQSTDELLRLIRSEVDMSQLAAHIRNTLRSSYSAQTAFTAIEFVIDGPPELPSPAQLLNEIPFRDPAPTEIAAPDLI